VDLLLIKQDYSYGFQLWSQFWKLGREGQTSGGASHVTKYVRWGHSAELENSKLSETNLEVCFYFWGLIHLKGDWAIWLPCKAQRHGFAGGSYVFTDIPENPDMFHACAHLKCSFHLISSSFHWGHLGMYSQFGHCEVFLQFSSSFNQTFRF